MNNKYLYDSRELSGVLAGIYGIMFRVYPRLYYPIHYETSDGVKVDIVTIDTVVLCGKKKDLQFSNLLGYLFTGSEQPEGPEDQQKADAHWEWLEQQLEDSR